jgi:hypothetical protein
LIRLLAYPDYSFIHFARNIGLFLSASSAQSFMKQFMPGQHVGGFPPISMHPHNRVSPMFCLAYNSDWSTQTLMPDGSVSF